MTMKKFVSLFLALVLLLSVLTIGILAADNQTSTVYTPDPDSIGITSLDQLNGQFISFDSKFHLLNDIVVTETSSIPFCGTLDGCGHTVTVKAPMFERFEGTIKNMTLEGTLTSDDGSNLAAVALLSVDGMNAYSITSNVSITITGAGKYAAAILCQFSPDPQMGGQRCNFSNIVNNGDIKVESTSEKPRAGGITAIANGAVYTNCVNNGDIYCKGTKSLAGGINARSSLEGYAQVADFYHCVNNGNITAYGEKSEAAGIAAYVGCKGNIVEYECYGCVNAGNVTAQYRAGGIFAYVYGQDMQFADIQKCINTGTITYGVDCDGYGSPFLAYGNTTNTLNKNIDVGSLVKYGADESYDKYSFIAISSEKYPEGGMNANYVKDLAAKFDYLVYSANTDGVFITLEKVLSSNKKYVCDVTLDDLKDQSFLDEVNKKDQLYETTLYSFKATDTLPVLCTGDKWEVEEGKYVYVPTFVFIVSWYECDEYSIEPTDSTHLSIYDDFTFKVVMDDTVYQKSESFMVHIDGMALNEVEGCYTLENVTSNVEVMVEGIEEIPNAIWGESADNLVHTGSLTTAVNQANYDSTVKYIKLTGNVYVTPTIRTGGFTLDLNGFDIIPKSSSRAMVINTYGAQNEITIVDTAENDEGVVEGDVYAIYVWGNSYLTIKGGIFKGNSNSTLSYHASEGVIDLSQYGDIKNFTIRTDTQVENISEVFVLPAGYGFYDKDGYPVSSFASNNKYSIGEAAVSSFKVDVVSNKFGEIKVSKLTADAGETVTVSSLPNKGYQLKSLIVLDADGNEITVSGNSFVMPESDVTVNAVFTKEIPTPTKSSVSVPEEFLGFTNGGGSGSGEGSGSSEGGNTVLPEGYTVEIELSYDDGESMVVIQKIKNPKDSNDVFAPIYIYSPCRYTFYVTQTVFDENGAEYEVSTCKMDIRAFYGDDGELITEITRYDVCTDKVQEG